MSAEQRRLSTSASQAWLLLLRQDARWTKLYLRLLHLQNLRSKAAVISPNGPVVSITSYGPRLRTVYLALESIAAGSMLPSRLILWIEDEEIVSNPPPTLRRLAKRGLEVRLTQDFGPHKKYYPYLISASRFDQPLVTADDDVLYSRWWLAGLARAHKQGANMVNCYRAHVMRLAHGKVQPYHTWDRCLSTEPSFRHFATGGSGCIYPASLLVALKNAGSKFLQVCPHADDVWLHANAVLAGFKIRQIRNRPADFPFVPGPQANGLSNINAGLGRNDEQIIRTYPPEVISRLLSC
jgi:hypothetical protein